MYKVKCIDCGNVGFTVSPRDVKCSCGGEHKVIPFTKSDMKSSDSEAQAFFHSRHSGGKN